MLAGSSTLRISIVAPSGMVIEYLDLFQFQTDDIPSFSDRSTRCGTMACSNILKVGHTSIPQTPGCVLSISRACRVPTHDLPERAPPWMQTVSAVEARNLR